MAVPSLSSQPPNSAAANVMPLAVKLPEAARLLTMGVSHVRKLLHAGELESFHSGRAHRIIVASIQNYVARQRALAVDAASLPRQAEDC